MIDPVKRKKYDSSLPFDDKIPAEEDVTSDEKFFELFTRCFKLNAQWATEKPVPLIGDRDTPLEEVKKFYKYWDGFKTWREFSQFDEYEVETAEDRYEKRWMEKQNKKLREKHEKEERKRIFTLTNRAYKLDPRIKAQAAKEEAERLAIKQAKKDAKAAQYKEIEDKRRQEEEAKAAALKEEEDKKAAEI